MKCKEAMPIVVPVVFWGWVQDVVGRQVYIGLVVLFVVTVTVVIPGMLQTLRMD